MDATSATMSTTVSNQTFINNTVGSVFGGAGDGVTWTPEDVNATSPLYSSSSTPRLPDPQYYDGVYHSVAVTLSSLVFVVGFVGNVLVVIVIARSRAMHSPTNCYLLSLAVADCLVLLCGTLPAIPETFYRVDEWPFGRVLCSLLVYAQYVGVDASSLSITAFTIERYIAICHPMRAQTMCTVSRAKRITGGLWLFTVLYCGPWLGLTDLHVHRLSDGSRITKCQFRLARSSYLVLYMFDLVVFYVLPLLISTALYALLARILMFSGLQHAPGSLSVRCPPLQRCRGTKAPEKAPRHHHNASSQRRGDSRVQVIRMLVVVVVAFATLWMPYRVMVVYNSFARHKWLDPWFLMLCRTLIYINCAINPILYNLMSLKFRRAFKSLLCCGLRPSGPPSQLYSETGTETVSQHCNKRHLFSSQRRHSPLRSLVHSHSHHPPDKRGWNEDDEPGHVAPSHTLKVTLPDNSRVKTDDKVKSHMSRSSSSHGPLPPPPTENGASGGLRTEGGPAGVEEGHPVVLTASDRTRPQPLADGNGVASRDRLAVSSQSLNVISESPC
ncbi:thyrotropin-releasing hormone receptor-like [Babylonia areolata]|uniref:thyrotropin-releasing hormone receptor-like n=1 Tax=Babylonia areolata TaxID=304850 RepID=UPI003FD04F30